MANMPIAPPARVTNLAGRVREKNVDDFVDDAKEFVRKSPVVAIGIAAVAGFALVRLLRTGIDDVSGGRAATARARTDPWTGRGRTEDQDDELIGDLVGRLVADGRAYAEAEFELYRVDRRASRRARAARRWWRWRSAGSC